MKNWIVVDLDGTLCDCAHRIDYAKAGLWDEFHSRCLDDQPHQDVLDLINVVGVNKKVLVVSGRTANYKQTTFTWLQRHGALVDAILLRPEMDFRHDTDLKIALLEEYFGSKEAVLNSIAFCLDDRDKVVEAFRNYGLSCWQVRQGEY